MRSHVRSLAALCCVMLSMAAGVSAKAAPRRNDTPKQMKHSGARQEGPVGVRPVLILDNATRARGRAATAGSSEALIFDQPNDSGFGWFMGSHNTLGLATFAHRMQFANGFAPGDSFSSYEATFFHSTANAPSLGNMDLMLELWDGDPASIMETVCTVGGVSAPIPGTQGLASIPHGTVARIRVELTEKVAYDCDRAWAGITILTGCRGAWRLAGTPLTDTFDVPPSVGASNGIWLAYPCDAFSMCPDGCGPGVCCGTGVYCDCQNPCQGNFAPAFSDDSCVSRVADYFLADYLLPKEEESYVGSLFAATETNMSVVPVSVDGPPSAPGDGTGVISLSGDEVILEDGSHNVWLEIRIGDWDPNDIDSGGSFDPAGRLAGYQPAIDAAAGFVSGMQGTLDVYVGSSPCGECSDKAAGCFSDDDCTAGTCSNSGDPCHLSSVRADCGFDDAATCDDAPAACVWSADANEFCATELGPGSSCGPPGYYRGSGSCAWTFTDTGRPDWAFAGNDGLLAALDLSSIDSRPSYASFFGGANDPEPFPAEGLYAATMAVAVPADAKGTFTIGLKPFPLSVLDSGAGPPIPLLGVIPAKITVQTGRCCFRFNSQHFGTSCLDERQTAESCAQLAGVTLFTPNESCPDNGGSPCECDPNEPATFDDDVPCTDDACVDGIALHITANCDDGLICTDDRCDIANGCTNVPVECDDGLGCTVDTCVEPGGCVFEPVDVDDGDACTVDACLEPDGIVIHQDLGTYPSAFRCPTGDPVADGCPAEATTCEFGFCRCYVCGDDIRDPGEACDGSDDSACFGRCRGDCQCPTCGDGGLDDGEQCDGSNDDACPGLCQGDCTCPSTIPTTNHWGLTALALLLLIWAKLYRRVQTA